MGSRALSIFFVIAFAGFMPNPHDAFTYQEVFAKPSAEEFTRAYKIIIPILVSAAIACLFFLLS